MDCLQLLGAGIWWILQIFAATLPVMVAWLAFRVSHQQKEISAQQARLALFERRVRVYEVTQKLILANLFPQACVRPSIEDFKLLEQAEFLFPDSLVPDFINKLRDEDQAVQMLRVQADLYGKNPSSWAKEIDQVDQELEQKSHWFGQQGQSSKSLFSEYLRVC